MTRIALALLILASFASCKNTYRTPKEQPSESLQAVRTGRVLAWADISLAMRICGQFMLESAWVGLFPAAEGERSEPPAMDEDSAALVEVRALATNAAGVSFAALTHVLSKHGFGSLTLEQNVQNTGGPVSPSKLVVRKGDEVRELRFPSGWLPRVIVNFGTETIRRRDDRSQPQASDPVLALAFTDAQSPEAVIPVEPAMSGVASEAKLAVGDYSACLREELSILQ